MHVSRTNDNRGRIDAADAVTVNWRSRQFWLRTGYVLTFIWIVAIYEITGGQSGHPLSRYMFIVPLAAWVVGLIVARWLFRRNSRAQR